MNATLLKGSRRIAPSALILLLPFVLFAWMMPFASATTLGDDYAFFPIQHQMVLMFSLKMGSFPLYVPGFCGGQSASALTQGQVYHPLAHIAALMPGYWQGHALDWNTLLRLLTLGCAHLALFTFLRAWGLSAGLSFLLSLVTVYNLRMLDLFRYGAALESWTGHLLLCAATGYLFLRPRSCTAAVAVVGATYWLVCSGHPQMAYYGMLGALVFVLFLPSLAAVTRPADSDGWTSPVHYWTRAALWVGAGIALSAAYLCPFYFDFLRTNAGRVGQTLAWADTFGDTLTGTVNNFLLPLRSDVHSAFGGSPLFLVAALAPLVRLVGVRVPAALWGVWGLVVVVLLYMLGNRTPLFPLAWYVLPFASSFRVAGRVAMILPVLLLLLNVWLCRAPAASVRIARRERRLPALTVVAGAALAASLCYCLLPGSVTSQHAEFSAAMIRVIPHWAEVAVFAAGLACLTALCAAQSPAPGRSPAVVAAFAAAVGLGVCLAHGTWIERASPTTSFGVMLAARRWQPDLYPFFPGDGLSSVDVKRHSLRTFLDPDLARVYTRWSRVPDRERAYRLMDEGRSPDVAVIEDSTAPQGEDTAPDTQRGAAACTQMLYGSDNMVAFGVTAPSRAYFVLAYPYSRHWQARVNGTPVAVCRANGICEAVRVPAGRSVVEFRYWSTAAAAGTTVSCLVLVAIGLWVSLAAARRKPRLRPLCIALAVLSVAAGTAAYTTWRCSLYTEGDFGSRLKWCSGSTGPDYNLAYGRSTTASGPLPYQAPFQFGGPRAVDGSRAPGNACLTGSQRRPHWTVDLGSADTIGTIVVCLPETSWAPGSCPNVCVFGSSDAVAWRLLGQATASDSMQTVATIVCPDHYAARFIEVASPDSCSMALNEVEVYPPRRPAAKPLPH